MASTGQSISQGRHAVEARIKTLLNNDLKEICRGENLAVSGVKAQLQTRILRHLEDIIKSGDAQAFARMRYRVSNGGRDDGFHAAPSPFASSSISPAPNRPMAASYDRPAIPAFASMRPGSHAARGIMFKQSPFYEVREALTQPQDLYETQTSRHTINMSFALTLPICERMKVDPNLRIMLYGATALIGGFAAVDVTFPNQIEVRVNGDEVRSNFKGLKNKPGTTKPADITDFVRKAPGYQNSVQIVYALTSKKYSLVINLVRRTSADVLAEKVRNGRKISKERVLKEMADKANDPDIVTTSSVMSLKDPISTMRITLPCRSTVCTHNQCFDGHYFLQLQEQAPTWTCPVCNKTLTFEALCVDLYVQDILQNTSKSTEQVTIEPSGQWQPVAQEAENNGGKGQARANYDYDSDDDVIEIPDTRVQSIKAEVASSTPHAVQQTPPLSSRENSTIVTTSASARPNKRTSAVIDLTLSDDDEPPRPAKRLQTSQNTSYNTPASLPEGSSTDMGIRRSVNLGYHNPVQTEQTNGISQPGARLPWQLPGPQAQSQTPVWAGSYRDSTTYASNNPPRQNYNGTYSNNSPGG